MASFSPPQDPSPPTHPSGVVVEIVGTERGDQGCSCEEHHINCGEVLAEDVVVRLRKVQILVEGKECSTQPYVCVDQIGQSRTRLNVLHADAVQRHNRPSGDQLA